jgi:hypothetical protein
MIFPAVAPFLETDIATCVTAAATMLTAVAAAVALGYARRELRQARETARIDLTFRLYERQLSPDFARHIAQAADFITIDGDGSERLKVAYDRCRRWDAMSRKEQAEIVLYLNHLEAVGGLFKMGRLDVDTAMRLFGQAAEAYWRRADWFIEHLRGPHGSAVFDKWEGLACAHRRWKPQNP